MTDKKHKNATKTDAHGPNAFVTEAYNLEDQQSMKVFYAKWADEYDSQMIDELGYISPFVIADKLRSYVTDLHSCILDIGCGTGLTCKGLAAQGFDNLYGVDLSQDMVNVAASRGIYKSLHAADVNLPLQYADEQFDAVISSGTFTHGHVGPEPLHEILRIMQPGGLLACTVHMEMWQAHGFEQKFAQLQESEQISCLSRELGSYYKNTEPEGWFCVYRKTD